jgi:6-pyruvoyltetrahydropterin/6-carboxytetrahydropterin synthase
MIEITKDFTFQAAHRLPKVPEGHKCARIHGHSYKVEVSVKGCLNERGWIVDFAEIEAAMAPFLEQLDHNTLNEVEGLENPTAEHIALWLSKRLVLKGLSRIVVHDEATCRATWTP